jgi:hypothetical protein
MSLTDDKIRKWSERGDPIHAWFSYQMVKESLASIDLGDISYVIYPQGSYANKTNIVADSDVDIVIALKSAFYPNKENLSEPELEEYNRYYQQSDLTWRRFRAAVVEVLRSYYLIQEKTKCVKVRSNLLRLPADVLVALDYRYYLSFLSLSDQTYADGVQFYTSENHKIINYPKRHIRACALKDDRVGGRYRRIVRVAKNARNALAADDESQIKVGSVPSYFLESLLWNVPDPCYRHSLPEAYREVIRWLHENTGELESMDFPNDMAKLFSETQDTVWNESQALTIINGLSLQLGRS